MTATWDFSADPASQSRLRAELRAHGFSSIRPRANGLDARGAAIRPWDAAAAVFGALPELVERQPIAAVPGGRTFASSARDTPLHSDSQLWRATPPHAQLMFCEENRARGGEILLVDAWALTEAIESRDADLFERLCSEIRRIPFMFGDFTGTTLSLRRGALVFTHSPQPAQDSVAERLAPALESAPRIRLRVSAGELLVVDNHRMLHGRTAFEGDRRFTRLLVWLAAPLGEHPRLAACARNDLGAELELDPEIARRRRAVLEMLRGEAPGVLARHYGVAEAELYRWRDAALRAVDAALGL